MISKTICLTVFFALLISAPIGMAAEHSVNQQTDVEELCKNVNAGDTIVLADGIWKDAKLTFDRLPGTEESPVTISATTPGKTVFTGDSSVRFSGQYVVVKGLVFQDTNSSDVLESRTHSERHANHCRITDCGFSQSADGPSGKESRWLSLYGTYNRVDHCHFEGKRSQGTTLVVWVSETPNCHQIDHNHFGPRKELGRNGGETVRIGTSEVSHLESHTVVTDNYFDRCNGESEIVSNKSCNNVYRHNVFHECSGALTLRHGRRCTVDANVFLGNKKSGTGGVRIIGSSHVVTNNYFANLRGDEMRAAISMMNALVDPKANEYFPVREALVAHNTFVDCKVSMELGVEASKKLSVAPANCIIASNLFASGKWPPLRFHSGLENFQWVDNRARKGDRESDVSIKIDQVAFEWEGDESDVMRPIANESITVSVLPACATDIDGGKRSAKTLVGCDDPATKPTAWANASTTGPSW